MHWKLDILCIDVGGNSRMKPPMKLSLSIKLLTVVIFCIFVGVNLPLFELADHENVSILFFEKYGSLTLNM